MKFWKIVGLGVLALIAGTGCATTKLHAETDADAAVQASPATSTDYSTNDCVLDGGWNNEGFCEIESP